MVNDNMNLKIRGLKLIKNEIKENINKIKIMYNTMLTLNQMDINLNHSIIIIHMD